MVPCEGATAACGRGACHSGGMATVRGAQPLIRSATVHNPQVSMLFIRTPG